MFLVLWAGLLAALGLLALTVFLLYVYGLSKVSDESFFETLRAVVRQLAKREFF